MSKRCKLQKEYYKEYGNYKGHGKYSDHYVKWLESEVLALRLYGVVKRLILILIGSITGFYIGQLVGKGILEILIYFGLDDNLYRFLDAISLF